MGLGTTPLIIFQFIIAAIDASGCERVIIGVWTSTKTASRRKPILSSWWRSGCVKWLAAEGSDVPGDAVDVVAAGGPADYLGTTYRGLVGLRLMRERWPDRRWYGILGDDNYVHWPSLVRGLDRVDRPGAPVCAGEVKNVTTRRNGIPMKMPRLMGGAGIFTNAEFVDALLPRLDGLAREVSDFYLCSRRPHARTTGPSTTAARAGRGKYANCTRPVRSHMFYVHDVFFSRIVEEMAVDLTPADFLYGTEPAVYVCGPERAATKTWSAHPPAVFHKFRLAKHMAWIDAVATGRPIADGDRRDGVMVRTRRISRLRCPFREIAVALCAVWETCPGGQVTEAKVNDHDI